ncbi:MAG: hypothetical protein EOO09_12410 [Chitinophagaceae bacterium]|nr:MAG: hypothetical protein EOO09_12410 [Chitinophagaceae bacterium]
MNRTLPALAITCLLFPAILQAQVPATTDFDSSATTYFQTHANELPVYNGRQHLGYMPTIIGYAYYGIREWQTGSVLYDGHWYHGVNLKYDLVADELILQAINLTGSVMIKSRIREFYLGDTHFVRSPFPASSNRSFYQEIANGQISLIAFHKKIIEEKTLEQEIERKFIYTIQYLAVTETGVHPVKRQKDLVKLLGDKRVAANASLKAAGFKWKENPERAMKHLVEFYNK